MPTLFAAMVFSLMPPTGSTLPVSDTSPVMATPGSTGLPSARESRAVTMVMPALGPSFGTAPSGTWRWTCAFWRKSFSGSWERRKLFATEKAMLALSFITSPRWPVSCSEPSAPFLSVELAKGRGTAVSMYSAEPPMAVQARPMTTPGGVTSYMRSCVNSCLPTKSLRLSGRTSTSSASLLTILKAAFLRIFSMCFWRFRTPLSRQ
uniref:Putative secreted protein n=1 Tax=Ixodes ricinus TaxID=34613 RepID=A0A6B0V2T5_IXORI